MDIHETGFGEFRGVGKMIAQLPFNRHAILLVATTNEWEISEIACESNAAADDNIRLRSGAFQPFAIATR